MAAEQPLLGFDLFEWEIDAELVSHRPDATLVNARRIEALGVSGVATVSTQLGGSLEVVTLAESDPIRLRLYGLGDGSLSELTAIEPRDVRLFALAGYDVERRRVLPSADDDRRFEAAIVDGDVVLLDAVRGGNTVELRACPGTGVISFSYLGAELSVPIEVTPAVADDACP